MSKSENEINLLDNLEKDEDGNGDEDDYYKIKVDSEKNDDDEGDSFNFSQENDNNKDDNIIEMAKEPNHSEEKKDTYDQTSQDKNILVDMGFDKALVDKIYQTVYPANVEEALDYVQKDENDKFIHSYIPNNLSVCSICGNIRALHAGESLAIERERERERQREREMERQRQRDRERLANASNSLNSNNKYTYNKYNFGKKECGVCYDEISFDDLAKVKLTCKHYFCVDCWTEYLKEKINNANVYKISCMDHKCGHILDEKFVRSFIDKDNTLLDKYEKFLTRKKLMDSNKKIKFCPIPDCDGYAEKKKDKYVKCNFGHEFCFECLQKPHGKKKCAKVIDEGFEEWKSHTLVKRCPYCKFWTEKNEGCNHMTCSQCNFQWCWVCERECVAGHYEFGPCKGLHFESVKSQEMAKELLKDNCGFCCVLTLFLTNFVYLLIYLLMMPCFYLAVLGIKHLKDCDTISIIFFCISFLPFFLCYEVWSIFYVVVLSIPGLFICPYSRFLKYILFGKILGELFPV